MHTINQLNIFQSSLNLIFSKPIYGAHMLARNYMQGECMCVFSIQNKAVILLLDCETIHTTSLLDREPLRARGAVSLFAS